MMPLQVEKPTLADMPALVHISVAANATSPAIEALSSNPTAPAMYEWVTQRQAKTWDASQQRLVRDTDTGEPISLLRYTFVAADNSDSWRRPPAVASAAGEGPPAEIFDQAAFQAAHGVMHEQRVKHMGPRAFLYVESLLTLPAHWRRGAGRLLVEHVAAQADAYNLPAFLVATEAGRPLYLKHGFADVETVHLDLGAAHAPLPQWTMVRPAAQPDQPARTPALPLRAVRVETLTPTLPACRAFEECTDAAFRSDALIELAFLGADAEPMDVRAAKLHRQLVEEPDDFLAQVAVDAASGEPLGYSKWMLVPDPQREMHAFGPGWPAGANVPLCEAMFGEAERRHANHFRALNKPYIYMASLMILPHAQRRGVGSALLRAGLAVSDARGWPAYINASPAGCGLYRKFGWKDFTSVTLNLKDYGGQDLEKTLVGLLREPNAPEVPRAEVAA